MTLVETKQLSGKHTKCKCGLAAVLHPEYSGTCTLTGEQVVARAQKEEESRGRGLRRR
jgi:hypothetical protein